MNEDASKDAAGSADSQRRDAVRDAVRDTRGVLPQAAAGRGTTKQVLEIFQERNEAGVYTGDYAYRLLIGQRVVEIPDDFYPRIQCFTTAGEMGSGFVTGKMYLEYGGPGECPEPYADMNGMDLHAVNVTGLMGMNMPVNVWWAIADALTGKIPIIWGSKQLPVLDPTSETDPYADADNDGQPNWVDQDDTDGPGWGSDVPGGVS